MFSNIDFKDINLCLSCLNLFRNIHMNIHEPVHFAKNIGYIVYDKYDSIVYGDLIVSNRILYHSHSYLKTSYLIYVIYTSKWQLFNVYCCLKTQLIDDISRYIIFLLIN